MTSDRARDGLSRTLELNHCYNLSSCGPPISENPVPNQNTSPMGKFTGTHPACMTPAAPRLHNILGYAAVNAPSWDIMLRACCGHRIASSVDSAAAGPIPKHAPPPRVPALVPSQRWSNIAQGPHIPHAVGPAEHRRPVQPLLLRRTTHRPCRAGQGTHAARNTSAHGHKLVAGGRGRRGRDNATPCVT